MVKVGGYGGYRSGRTPQHPADGKADHEACEGGDQGEFENQANELEDDKCNKGEDDRQANFKGAHQAFALTLSASLAASRATTSSLRDGGGSVRTFMARASGGAAARGAGLGRGYSMPT